MSPARLYSLKAIVFACTALSLLTVAETAVWAAPKNAETALDTGPVVRRQLLLRSGRLEIAPTGGATMNDAYIRNTMAGLNVNYHLTNTFSIGFNAGFALSQTETDLSQNLKATLENEGSDQLENISFSKVDWTLDLGLSYVPIHGKFSLFNKTLLNFDIHLIGGLAIVNESALPAMEFGFVDPMLEGIRPAGMLGLGWRIFIGDMISLNIEVRDYLYSRAEVSRGTANPQLQNNLITSVGLGFFLPGSVRISR